MPPRRPLPDLSPAQVVALMDALLANADRLLRSAILMLDADETALARSLAILGMEESGKAIALHERRVMIAHSPEGDPFVDDRLQKLWASHHDKLRTVHDFLVEERYWFGVEPSDPEINAAALGTIEAWVTDHNHLKQRGFYVDVTAGGDPLEPEHLTDADAVRDAIAHIHQVGWQLRLGEHIEGKQQADQERAVPPATAEELASMKRSLRSVDPAMRESILQSMRSGSAGTPLSNAAYRIELPSALFENVGRRGYEAEDRELARLWELNLEGDST